MYKNSYFIYKLRSSGEFTEAECADFPQLNEDSNESNNNFVNANEVKFIIKFRISLIIVSK